MIVIKLSNEEKIAKINNDRKIILNNIKDRLKSSNEMCNNDFMEIANLINFEDKSQKEYKAIIEAKNLIFELTKEISNSTSVDEIISIRKRINYYINKIKNILKKRGIYQKQIDNISEKSTYLRKNIACYIRFLKRKDKIAEIINLSDKDMKTIEEKDRLKKLLKNELRFNKRNQEVNEKEDIKYNEDLDDNGEIDFETIFKLNDNKPVNRVELDFDFEKKGEKQEYDGFFDYCIEFSDESAEDRITENMLNESKNFEAQYGLEELNKYDSYFIINLIKLLGNIPKIIHNKKMIKFMESDYRYVYRGEDLRKCIEIAIQENSIVNSLRYIFRNSILSNREDECLNIHNNILLDSLKPVINDDNYEELLEELRSRKL